MEKYLITGAAGFIGSNFVNSLDLETTAIVALDRLDYCAKITNIDIKHREHPNFTFVRGSICNYAMLLKILQTHQITHVVHFAAQTHVDNSFQDSLQFTHDNTLGTHTLLEACREYGKVQLFLNFSTDEVLGECDGDLLEGYSENQILDPTNPYAASKCGAEMMALSYYRSYKMPIITTRCNNVYGPRQYPEKLIPRFILRLLRGQNLPIQGTGSARRMFIYVDDVCSAVKKIIENGKIGEIYHIGTDIKNEFTVREMTQILMNHLDSKSEIVFVKDRDFNDCRYFLNNNKLKSLGWDEHVSFEEGLKQTIKWYQENESSYETI